MRVECMMCSRSEPIADRMHYLSPQNYQDRDSCIESKIQVACYRKIVDKRMID